MLAVSEGEAECLLSVTCSAHYVSMALEILCFLSCSLARKTPLRYRCTLPMYRTVPILASSYLSRFLVDVKLRLNNRERYLPPTAPHPPSPTSHSLFPSPSPFFSLSFSLYLVLSLCHLVLSLSRCLSLSHLPSRYLSFSFPLSLSLITPSKKKNIKNINRSR